MAQEKHTYSPDFTDEEFESLVVRREMHEPMHYILGSVEFYGLNFKVNMTFRKYILFL